MVNLLVVRARLSGELQVFGGDQYRPLLHVRDVATAIVPHLESDVRGIYNLGTENITILQLAERVVERVGGAEIAVVDVPFQDTRNYKVSDASRHEELGSRPRYSVDIAIDEIAQLIDEGRVRTSHVPVLQPRGAAPVPAAGGDPDGPRDPQRTPPGSPPALARARSEDDRRRPEGDAEPELIAVNAFTDDRGRVYFANDFDLRECRGCTSSRTSPTGTVRAWHAHQHERKWVMALTGAALACCVKIDDWDGPSPDAPVHRFTLDAPIRRCSRSPPATQTVRWRCCLDTKLLYLSDASLEESMKDDFRTRPATGIPGTSPSDELRDLDRHPDAQRRRPRWLRLSRRSIG